MSRHVACEPVDTPAPPSHDAPMTLLYVALGGALGATLRYLVTLGVPFPFGTLAVNVLGCFVMGLAWVWLADRGLDRLAVLGMTGVLGGFTTFSAFSLDAVRLYEQGALPAAALYVLASVALSLLAILAAILLARMAA